ncbi:MAG: hypothetical protein ACXWU1_08990, partial [Allosphingosinicella sp.]
MILPQEGQSVTGDRRQSWLPRWSVHLASASRKAKSGVTKMPNPATKMYATLTVPGRARRF